MIGLPLFTSSDSVSCDCLFFCYLQGRQKLAKFNKREFATLIIDILNDAKRRYVGLMSPTNKLSKDKGLLAFLSALLIHCLLWNSILTYVLVSMTDICSHIWLGFSSGGWVLCVQLFYANLISQSLCENFYVLCALKLMLNYKSRSSFAMLFFRQGKCQVWQRF